MRLAAIDIGANSCRLLIADVDNDRIFPICTKVETTRLGESAPKAGILNPLAIERTVKCLSQFKALINQYQVETCLAVATSAVREASNAEEFLSQILTKVGISINIIDGQQEARLSHLGVARGLNLTTPSIVIDLGGGSTEFILPAGQGFLISLPIGAVRATELKMSAVDIFETIFKSEITLFRDKLEDNPLVFVGGTATSLVAIKLSLEVYNRDQIHGQILTRREVADIYNMLERMPLSLRKRVPGLQPERADIIPKGALIILIIMDFLRKNEITISESDLLQGLIWEKIGTI